MILMYFLFNYSIDYYMKQLFSLLVWSDMGLLDYLNNYINISNQIFFIYQVCTEDMIATDKNCFL